MVMQAAKETLGAQVAVLMSRDHRARFPFAKANLYDAGIPRAPLVV